MVVLSHVLLFCASDSVVMLGHGHRFREGLQSLAHQGIPRLEGGQLLGNVQNGTGVT